MRILPLLCSLQLIMEAEAEAESIKVGSDDCFCYFSTAS